MKRRTNIMPKFKSIPQREHDIEKNKAIRAWALGRITAQELTYELFAKSVFTSLQLKERRNGK